ncbi:MAG: hypothetical protein QG628_999 [Patescibacteria group bacterium]|nr:hypothetical protein [Patescibacteria group bacterium]
MGIHAARHGLSGANDQGNPAFASPEAKLLPTGVDQAVVLGSQTFPELGIDPSQTDVATSTFLRAQETAQHAGFGKITSYDSLDEIKHGLDYEGYMTMKQTRVLPLHALRAAEQTLIDPPLEKVWIFHGLRISAICQILGIYEDSEFLFPKFCEVRYIPIND